MKTKFVEKDLENIKYTVYTSSYSDTISVSVYKNEKMGKVFKCQLYPLIGGALSGDELIANVTPEPLLGSSDADVAGRFYTETIASLILRQAPNESRNLVLGLGNLGPRDGNVTDFHKRELLHVTEMIQEASVWQ